MVIKLFSYGLEALPYNLISLNIAVVTQSHNVCLSKIYVQSF